MRCELPGQAERLAEGGQGGGTVCLLIHRRSWPARTGLRTPAWWGLALVFSISLLMADDSPPLPPPAGSIEVVRDACANFWALGPADSEGRRGLLVLPAQSPVAWSDPQIPGLAAGPWQSVVPQRDRTITVGDAEHTLRFDPRWPERGVATFARAALPPVEPATPWRRVTRMPAGNHDLTASVLAGRFYVAGGQTSDFGFPAQTRAFDELWELEATGWRWRAAAKFSRPRIYCATVAFADRVWVVGGDVLHEDGQRRASTLVESFDPRTGKLTREADLPVALPAPLALVAGGRLWIVGARNRTERGQMASIGPGESVWRAEPEALPHMWALAGAACDDRLYVCVPNTGLAVFDLAAMQWSVIPGPSQPRSAQVAAWRGELWIMGGCDIPDWSETRIYNPAQRTWRSGPSLPEPLAWGAAAVIEDRLVVTGGAAPHGPPDARNYAFSDRTYMLSPDSIPALPAIARGDRWPRWSDATLRGTGEAGLPFTTVRVFPDFKFGRLGTILPVPGSRPDAPEQLNRDADYSALGRRVENQLVALSENGLLRPAFSESPAQLPRKADPSNPTLPLESRVRAYLDINCAHCHQTGGVGGRAAFQLKESLPIERTGLIDGRPQVPLLGPDAKLVEPGQPERSEVFHRFTLAGGGRMPLLGSEQIDPEGTELLRRWILQMHP